MLELWRTSSEVASSFIEIKTSFTSISQVNISGVVYWRTVFNKWFNRGKTFKILTKYKSLQQDKLCESVIQLDELNICMLYS